MPRRRARTNVDKNHLEVPKALKDRCGGYWKNPDLPHHYAHLKGLHVCAYDTHGVGNGFPDWEVWVSWLCMGFEVKQERPAEKTKTNSGQFQTKLTDDEYYRAQLEDSELFYHRHHSGLIAVVWDRNQVYEWLNAMADFVLYCEHKAEASDELLALFFPRASKLKMELGRTYQ